MKLIKPFRGLRPASDMAAEVASHPYDVINREEAQAIAKGNPYSFLHINKPEIDIDSAIDIHDQSVYDKGSENLNRFIEEGILLQDTEEKLYVYKQVMGEHEQIGLVAVASVEAYEQNLIKKHEFTRPEKEDDRVAHMDALGAQVGPVFLTYKSDDDVDKLIAQVVESTPEYEFDADDGTHHVFWVVEDVTLSANIESAFERVDCLYVADGHHRSAAASRVKNLHKKRNTEHSGEEPYNFFLVVLFPHNQMQILDYNRVVKDLQGAEPEQFLEKLRANFDVSKVDLDSAKPGSAKEFALYMDKQWYQLKANTKLVSGIQDDDPVKSLDVSILQDIVFTPLLGIIDQRVDTRVDFVGGIRGLKELEKRVDSGDWKAAFALYPTSIESLMAIADAGEVMPPKSTWFEPKLKSGLIVHMLD
ncbi:MAG: hypothetical protein COA96_12475 [SAR86 cluster bacterium]|uniref:DUF1015 domain-containing protein n=1 Tax=SAR86 cluster bacterium TaxID=2030880 RepID=A0A2A5AVA8_9GAMM|nr:MAG: hypothetical protein COA96_12475 [SAR86 cluster bacterium]